MAVLLAVNAGYYPAGTQTTPVAAIPAGIETVRIGLSREAWPDTGGDVVSAMIDLSLDGGATWRTDYFGFTAAGGTFLGRSGAPVLISWTQMPIPESATANRQARARVTLTVPLRTAVTIEGF